MKFSKFLTSIKLTSASTICERIIGNIVNFSSDKLNYQPIKDEISLQQKFNQSERFSKSRKNFRNPQPTIDITLQKREENANKTTHMPYEILRNQSNKTESVYNPVLHAEIFKNLERNEFLYLPHVDLTESDQKVLFDIGVSLKYAKTDNLVECLLNELPRVFKDFPIEAIFNRKEIVEQIIIFGNSNNEILKAALIPSYKVILEKMLQKLKDLEDNKFRNVSKSKTAHDLLENTDKIYLK